MAGIIQAVSSAVDILDVYNRTGGNPKEILKELQTTNAKMIKADGSIIKVLDTFIIEPICVISKDLKDEDYIDDLIALHTDVFSALYLQAFEVMRSVYGTDVATSFDLLATDNSGVGRAVLSGTVMALEEAKCDEAYANLMAGNINLSTEAKGGKGRKKNNGVCDDACKRAEIQLKEKEYELKKQTLADNNTKAMYDKDIKEKTLAFNIKKAQDDLDYKKEKDKVENDRYREKLELDLRENRLKRGDKIHKKEQVGINKGMTDLLIPNVVQRMLQVEIVSEDANGRRTAIQIPITVKTSVILTDVDNIINAVAPNHDDKSFLNRLDDYRSGAISLTDFIFAGDIVKSYKKNKLKDKSDLLKTLQSRKISANSKAVGHGIVGFEKHYTMYIVTESDKIVLENFLRGKLKSGKVKQKFLEEGYGLSLSIVDRDHERLIIRYIDMKGETNISLKAAVKHEKKHGGDVTEIVKALMDNKAPSF